MNFLGNDEWDSFALSGGGRVKERIEARKESQKHYELKEVAFNKIMKMNVERKVQGILVGLRAERGHPHKGMPSFCFFFIYLFFSSFYLSS